METLADISVLESLQNQANTSCGKSQVSVFNRVADFEASVEKLITILEAYYSIRREAAISKDTADKKNTEAKALKEELYPKLKDEKAKIMNELKINPFNKHTKEKQRILTSL